MVATCLKKVGRGATKGGKKVVLKRNGYGRIVQLISFIGKKLVRGRSENGQIHQSVEKLILLSLLQFHNLFIFEIGFVRYVYRGSTANKQ